MWNLTAIDYKVENKVVKQFLLSDEELLLLAILGDGRIDIKCERIELIIEVRLFDVGV